MTIDRASADTQSPTASRTSLHRVLGMTEVVGGGVGIIIGAGIYVLLGAATADAGGAVWLAFLLAAVLSALTGLSYAELSSMFPSAAGEYEYTRQALPAWVAFGVGWMMIAGLVVAAGAVSLGFARYVGYFVVAPARLVAMGLLVLVAFIAVSGIKRSARFTVVLSAIQVVGLLAVIAIGVPHIGDVDLLTSRGPDGVLAAAALVFFAFIGFDEVITLAEETRDPTRVVPRALLLALGISAALYIAVAVAAVSVIGADALAASPRPLADVMAHALGPASASVVAAIALVSTMNTTLLSVTAASRLVYGMAIRDALPRGLASVHPRRRTPVNAIVVVVVVAAAFAMVGKLTLIAAVTDFAIYLVFLVVNITVIVLRRTRPDLRRPFAMPGALAGVPVAAVLGFVSVLIMMTQLEPTAVKLGIILSVAGVVFGGVMTYRSRRTTTS